MAPRVMSSSIGHTPATPSFSPRGRLRHRPSATFPRPPPQPRRTPRFSCPQTQNGPRSLPGTPSLFRVQVVKLVRQPQRRPGSDPTRCGAARASCGSSPSTLALAATELKAVVFDCDGVILESEDLHRQSYNATFQEFRVRCPGDTSGFVHWDTHFYDQLQNKIGGGKPKMRWFFNKNGWPHSTLFDRPPTTDEARAELLDALQDWKTKKYQQLIGTGSVPPRPGVVELMDEARAQGLLVAVCSAATKSSVIFTLQSLLGQERFDRLDCFLAGDDVPKKKPDPIIYKLAAQRLGVSPRECVVVEDSVIGLQAAAGAGMPCVITHTSSTRMQDFSGSIGVLPSLEGVSVARLKALLSSFPQPLSAVAGASLALTTKYL